MTQTRSYLVAEVYMCLHLATNIRDSKVSNLSINIRNSRLLRQEHYWRFKMYITGEEIKRLQISG
jgi:hypothetical protein